MEADTQAHVAFFLTGRRLAEHLAPVDGLDLRPALFARYRDLTQLRYDFPLVLVAGGSGDTFVHSLSGLVDAALAAATKDGDAERIGKHGVRVEREIRALAAGGAGGKFSSLWEQAVTRLLPGADKTFADSVKRVRGAIKVDGEVADCDAALPARLLRHAWATVQRQKGTAFRKRLDRLVLQLGDILQADFEHSEAGRSAARLQQSIGTANAGMFDFDAMSRMLTKARSKSAVPEGRLQRIRELLAVLNAQRFSAPSAAGAKKADAPEPYSFSFASCSAALAAFRERLPRLVELASAIAVAELEIDGQYDPAKHDALFKEAGTTGLDAQDLAPFPDYLVCVNAGDLSAEEHAQLMDVMSSGLPIKVLLQLDDILEESTLGEGNPTAGLRSRQIASMAIGLNEVYVLQSSSANLFRLRDRIRKGLEYLGPALFSVFSGASGEASDLPAYLVAAAATESRAFPAFSYDPSAGPNWASRFSLEANSQVDLDWPIQGFAYEDGQHQRVSEDLAFTLVDFVATDRRYARHLAVVPRAKWNGSFMPVDESLSRDRKGVPDKVPSVFMVDRNDVLQKVIVDQRLIRDARRCREIWHSLQELGGVHNSHAERLLAREMKSWEGRMQKDAEAHAPAAGGAPAAAGAASAPVAEEPARSSDEAYIETERCSTCNECTQLNGRMFAYNANKQAYIADINAGTYAQLVQAAESCQVAVIHPGKPRNPNEPGLEDLMKRAEAFA
ncbi:MAG: hypothetical protein Q8N53_03315 [Longimicrobiales bacterium]|nr:hypothetical protein [Longimicrobiales bacterium]